MMTESQINQIYELKESGLGYRAIASKLCISPNSVKTFLRRHPTADDTRKCKYCGKQLSNLTSRRKRIFCSDSCKHMWYHKFGKGKTAVCLQCDKEFRVSPKHVKQKYCCVDCYHRSRKKDG